MTIIICVIILILIVVQFCLYRKNQKKSLKGFMKSKDILDIIKELCLILLGAILALHITYIEEKRETKETIINLLDVVEKNTSRQIIDNNYLINIYCEGEINFINIKERLSNNSSLLENVLNNDTVIITIPPLIYNMLISDLQKQITLYNKINGMEYDDGLIVQRISEMNSYSNDIIWELEYAKAYLEGASESELSSIMGNHIRDKYNM